MGSTATEVIVRGTLHRPAVVRLRTWPKLVAAASCAATALGSLTRHTCRHPAQRKQSDAVAYREPNEAHMTWGHARPCCAPVTMVGHKREARVRSREHTASAGAQLSGQQC
jgi:hypothetical protein